jgi:hypothetical protein
MQLDAFGTALLIPGVVCLLLALQWGGQTYAVCYPHHHLGFSLCVNSLQWSNGRIIALLTLTGILLLSFAAVQILLPTTATLPQRIFKQWSVGAALVSTLCISSGNYMFGKKPTE